MIHVERVMGTVVSLEVIADEDPDDAAVSAVAEVVAWLHEVDERFSPFREESVISRLGRGQIGLDHPSVRGDVADVLQSCAELRALTGGVFDVNRVPAPNGTMFNPCGYVKGWAVQRAGELLRARGWRDWCINAGGDVLIAGERGRGEPWRIGIRHPDRADALAAVIESTGPLGVATSGSYERGAHIVDPRDGQAVTELASVTVVGPELRLADAYATTVYAMGLDGLTWLAGRSGYEGCAITRDDQLIATPGFAAYEAGALRS